MKVSESIETLVPYKAGKSIEATQRELGIEKVYKLASNENPLGVSEKVLEAIHRVSTEIHRYPEPSHFSFGKGTWKVLRI